jgi:uncharacterized protein YjbI with pentapeptide repeats
MIDKPRVRKRVVTTHRIIPTWLLWVALVTVLVASVIAAGYTILEPVSGFTDKMIWDWLKLAGVSTAIALVGWIVTRRQRERDETIALEQAQDEALRAYLDQMSNLMVDHKLSNARDKGSKGEPEHNLKQDGKREVSKKERLHKRLGEVKKLGKVWTKKAKVSLGLAAEEPEDYIHEVARARTAAILLSLDGYHKRRPLKLVYELGLIDKGENVLELKNAGLDHADLSELSLRKADLRRADLRASDLSGADLSDSDLSEADLRGADLRRAHLSGTDLTKANLLPYDERDPERLSAHRLKRLNLSEETLSPRKLTLRDSRIIIEKRGHWWPTVTELTITNLRGATLAGAHLREANLGGADLAKADLSNVHLRDACLLETNLKGADLSGADLKGADLSGADLTDAKLTKHQLAAAKSLEGATMPNGQSYEKWRKKSRGRMGK